ncbi:MAG: pyridoxamine 5'-phosphate oxidase family protein [Opitutales bacterium]|nr:pyridoxamine 5'-phosphate oxidase family protein [Opitutales bacterium]
MSEKSTLLNTETIAEDAQMQLSSLLRDLHTLVLATVNASKLPDASYAPFTTDEDGNFYVYVSALAKHTGNFRRSDRVSILLIEDESACANYYARKRLTLNCEVEPIERDSQPFQEQIQCFHDRFGRIMDALSGMKDFQLYRLKPIDGRLVLGFGAAFRVKGLKVDSQLSGRHRSER